MTAAIELRANSYCNLGPLIGANFAYDYLQEAGLAKMRGSCTLATIIVPHVGAVVEFGWHRAGVISKLPYRFRVLSSFADPQEGITTVQIGDLLALREDLRQPDKMKPETAYARERKRLEPAFAFSGFEAEGAVIATTVALRYHAKDLAAYALEKLGITAAGVLSLEKSYLPDDDDFDFSRGYAEVLGKLLESECLLGYLDETEELVVRDLRDEATTGPVLDASNVIEMGPIGVGEQAGEEVVVEYEGNAPLKKAAGGGVVSIAVAGFVDPADPSPPTPAPSMPERSGTQTSTTYGFSVTVPIPYQVGETSGTIYLSYIPVTTSRTFYQDGRPVAQESVEIKPAWAANSSYASQMLSIGRGVPNGIVELTTTTQYQYNKKGEEVQRTATETGPSIVLAGRANLPYAFDANNYVILATSDVNTFSQTTIYNSSYGANSKTETVRYQNYLISQEGQQGVSEGRITLASPQAVVGLLESLRRSMAFEGVEVTHQSGLQQPQRQANPRRQQDAADGRTQASPPPDAASQLQTVVLQQALTGSSTTNRIVRFRLPYTAASTFRPSLTAGTGGSYGNNSTGSFVAEDGGQQDQALNYGRIQNRLRLGNRMGMSLRLPVEWMPPRPFDAAYISFGGHVAQYRMNGISYTIDAENGIVASADALFWGGVGS